MTLAFILSMPNVGSWNGRWSGESNCYALTKSLSGKKGQVKAESILAKGSFYYNFGDGWGASIEVKAVDGLELREIRRKTKGFCGYEWMVDSILADGSIYGPTQPKPQS